MNNTIKSYDSNELDCVQKTQVHPNHQNGEPEGLQYPCSNSNTYGLETMVLTKMSACKLQRSQRAVEWQMLYSSLRVRITSAQKTQVAGVLKKVARLK